MRAYRVLKKRGQVAELFRLYSLTVNSLHKRVWPSNRVFTHDGVSGYLDETLSGYLAATVHYTKITHALLDSRITPDRKQVLALPPEWVAHLKENGVRTNDICSNLLWFIKTAARLVFGIVRGLTIVFMRGGTGSRQENSAKTTYLSGFPVGAFPSKVQDDYSYLSWLDSRYCRGERQYLTMTRLKIQRGSALQCVKVRAPIGSLKAPKSRLAFLTDLLLLSIQNFWELIRFRWWSPYLMPDYQSLFPRLVSKAVDIDTPTS